MQPKEDFLSSVSEKLTPVTDIDIKALSGIYDEKDVYLSVYLPVAGRENEHLNESFVDMRLASIKKALPKESRKQFEKTFSMAQSQILGKPISGERGRIIFASASGSFLHVYRFAVEPERSMVLDTSPFLLPLARLRADYEDYGLVLVDSREARFFCIRSDNIEERKHLSTDLMNKHKKGGWSQMRFNHLRKESIKAFLSEVADSMRDTCAQLDTKGLVIAGPGDAKQQLADMLPDDIGKRVLGIIDTSMDIPRDRIVEAGDAIVYEEEHSRAKRRAEELRAEILKGGLAVQGVKTVRDALESGRVNVLLLLKGSSLPGWICERCQNLQPSARPPEECERCGGPTSEVDFMEELYELAQRTGAEVEFIEKEDMLEPDDLVGALLRY
ncbi:Vms1/Ankzf1 family peptidyl-tRNA hydrolase [Methanolobus sp. ZRKC3]|uniref:baeRF10 domain-containing protein n=1 Tax=Methanolobus sp. ZRKC3 TaxID=3125786 RepID=UPI0032477A72